MDMCPRCFEMNEATADYCRECGAPLSDTPSAEGSDQAVYADLARTNLLRMRGDYKAAADVCLGILRRFPNNATAHALMGDIYAEQGDLKHAIEWYEMALDLNGESSQDVEKLQRTRDRLKAQETRSTAKDLGIPERAPRSGLFAVMMSVTILAVAVTAFLLGGRFQGLPRGPGTHVVDAPIDVPVNAPPTSALPAAPESAIPEAPAAAGPPPTPVGPMARLQALMPSGYRLTDVKEDPRGPRYTLSVEGPGTGDPAIGAAEVALAVFAGAAEPVSLTIRIGREGRLVYVADVDRADASAQLAARAGTPAGQAAPAADPAILRDPWPPAAPAPPATP